MKLQDTIFLMFILIMIYLVLSNPTGTNQILSTGGGTIISLTKTLQGR